MAEIIKLGSTGNWGVKPNGVLAYNDENNVFKAIELQSSRASGATYVGEDGLIKDAEVGVPRIDWTNGVGELLLEPQRRNKLTYSEEFTDASWTKSSGAVVLDNQSVSPDGSTNADEYTKSASFGSINKAGVAVGIGFTYTLSVYVKQNTATRFTLRVGSGSNDVRKYFQFSDQTWGNASGGNQTGFISNEAIDVGNGWYRLILIVQSGGTTAEINFYSGQAGNTSFDGATYIWGAQFEDDNAGGGSNYPTSYIRTEGSQVTRIQDAVSGNSSLENYINSSEGVLYFEGSCLVDDEGDRRISLSDGSASVYRLTFDSSGRIFAVAYNGGSNQCVLVFDTDLTQNFKCAFKYKQNDFSLWVNGVEVGADPSGSVSSSMNKLSLDAGSSSGAKFFGKIRELKVYDTALTDSQLQTLTTI